MREVDEDILAVFRVDEDWLIVCETSVQLCGRDDAISRVDPPDVVVGYEWKGDTLVLDIWERPQMHLQVVEGHLQTIDDSDGAGDGE